jgi:phospholipase/carboxylesterase
MNDSRSDLIQSRREFFAVMAAGSATLFGCTMDPSGPPSGGSARLTARPTTPSTTVAPGTWLFNPSNSNDGCLVVPSGYDPAHPVPLVVALHGAGVLPDGPVELLGPSAESRGYLLLAPGSRGLTWDVLTSRFSYDVTFIDSMLKWAFDRCAVDPARIILQGFSDGATYALGLGLANGDLFTRVVANSAAYIPGSDSPPAGEPRFFVSHGKQDPVLRIDGASRDFVPSLRKRGYTVDYTEFDGGHEIPPAILAQTVDWFLS